MRSVNLVGVILEYIGGRTAVAILVVLWVLSLAIPGFQSDARVWTALVASVIAWTVGTTITTTLREYRLLPEYRQSAATTDGLANRLASLEDRLARLEEENARLRERVW
jgi:hypothetical protein